MNITILRPQTVIAAVCAAVAAQAAVAQEPINPVYRVVVLEDTPPLSPFQGIYLREDNAVIFANFTGGFVGGQDIPWTTIPELTKAAIGDVNATGQICGTILQDGGTYLPFIASPTPQGIYDTLEFLPIDPFTSVRSAFHDMDIADDGTVVGGTYLDGGHALLWSPGATEVTVITSNDPDVQPFIAHQISPSGNLIFGDAITQPGNRWGKFVAPDTANPTHIQGTQNGGHVFTFRGATDKGLVLVDIATDTFDGPVEIWRIDGTQHRTVRSIGYADSFVLLQNYPRMSSSGRALALTNRLVTWFDDGTKNGAVIPIEDRLWTDETFELSFMGNGGDINDSGVIAIRAAHSGDSYDIVLLIPTCRADVNADGSIDPTDFDAWLAAYQAGSHRADQNADGQVTPTDFNAWIAGYNAGCDLP